MRSLSVVKFTVTKRNARGINKTPQVLSALPLGGADFLNIAEKMISSLSDDDLVDSERKSYLVHESSTASSSRSLCSTWSVGRFGESGETRDVKTHDIEHSHGPTKAHTVKIRTLMHVPEGGKAALLFAERSHPHSAASALRDRLRAVWGSLPVGKEFTLKDETLVEVPAWLDTAELRAVVATRYGHATDFEGTKGDVLGEMNYSFTPASGQSSFPRRLYEAVRDADSKLERAKILGIQEDAGVDSVRVTLGAGDREKTFVIDDERTPPVRLALTELEGDPSKPNHFVSRCMQEAQDLLPIVSP